MKDWGNQTVYPEYPVCEKWVETWTSGIRSGTGNYSVRMPGVGRLTAVICTSKKGGNLFICGPGQPSQYSDFLLAGRSEDRIQVGARFYSPVQTGPGAHPAPYKGYRVSFRGVKWPGRGVDHLPPSSAEVKEREELYLYSPSGSSWPVLGRTLPLPLPIYLFNKNLKLDGFNSCYEG
jgi:hypothetical protein